tara:strand:- start:190 stop:567 length:378 start_codon:yes stop_codon:yes gene_type:complete
MEALLIAIVSCLVGVIIGHRLSLGRDRRKEHNEVIRPIKQQLLEHLGYLSEGSAYLMLNEKDINSLYGVISKREYGKILLVFSEYKEVIEKNILYDSYGQIECSKTGYDKIIRSAENLNKILKVK